MTPQERAKLFLGRADVSHCFGRSPIVATVDVHLSDGAHRALSLLASKALSTNAISLSYEEIAWAFGCSRSKAIRLMKELEKSRYVGVRRGHNKCNFYTLEGDVFSKLEHVDNVSTVHGPEAATFLRCAKCARPCRGLGREGWCRTCRGDVDEERRYWEAKRVIGEDATLEQIAAHLHLEKITKRLRRIARRCDPAA